MSLFNFSPFLKIHQKNKTQKTTERERISVFRLKFLFAEDDKRSRLSRVNEGINFPFRKSKVCLLSSPDNEEVQIKGNKESERMRIEKANEKKIAPKNRSKAVSSSLLSTATGTRSPTRTPRPLPPPVGIEQSQSSSFLLIRFVVPRPCLVPLDTTPGL